MKKIVLFILLISCKYLYAQDISGAWNWQYKEGKHISKIVLESSSENSYKGNYCSVFYNGGKIDCSQNEFYIEISKMRKNTFKGTFNSPSFDGSGEIKLTYLHDVNSLKLEILSSKGEFYLPDGTFQR